MRTFLVIYRNIKNNKKRAFAFLAENYTAAYDKAQENTGKDEYIGSIT